MLKLNELKKIYGGKKVLITGHTGFKGSYLCVLLNFLGAKVYGYSLKPEKNGLYELLKIGVKESKIEQLQQHKIVSGEVFADIRDEKKLTSYVKKIRPDYIIHMAAQPLVLLGYEKPHYTYDVNVMGTVNLMEAIRKTYLANDSLKFKKSKTPVSILNVTTDKVYENNDLSNYAFKENDKLSGRDPYANSKSCSELVTYAYNKSYFYDKNIFRISTARAGNVIGGGDLNKNRIIPDCYRAIKDKKEMFIRNPLSIRPYQYVLEPLILYLNILAYQVKDQKYEGNYNIGPDKKSCLNTKMLVEKFYNAVENYNTENALMNDDNNKIKLNISLKRKLKENSSNEISLKKVYLPKVVYNNAKQKTSKHEAAFLRLDNSLIKKTISYKEIFSMEKTMEYTSKVYIDMLNKKNLYDSIIGIIKNFE